jgi:hypothetical protein
MQIHVARAGKELGAFSLEEVRAGLSSGKFLPTDFGWMDGQPDWARLDALPGLTPTPPPEPESTPVPAAELTESEEGAPRPRVFGSHVRLPKQAAAAPASSLAVASLVCGVLSLSAVPLILAIPAIICGHLARQRIRRSEGALGGDGLALGGLITGYLSLFLFGLIGALIFFLAARFQAYPGEMPAPPL